MIQSLAAIILPSFFFFPFDSCVASSFIIDDPEKPYTEHHVPTKRCRLFLDDTPLRQKFTLDAPFSKDLYLAETLGGHKLLWDVPTKEKTYRAISLEKIFVVYRKVMPDYPNREDVFYLGYMFERLLQNLDNDDHLYLDQMFEGHSLPDPFTQKALYWYGKAADHGHPGAAFRLCDIHEHGLGVAQNGQKAIYYREIAIKNQLDREREQKAAQGNHAIFPTLFYPDLLCLFDVFDIPR